MSEEKSDILKIAVAIVEAVSREHGIGPDSEASKALSEVKKRIQIERGATVIAANRAKECEWPTHREDCPSVKR